MSDAQHPRGHIFNMSTRLCSPQRIDEEAHPGGCGSSATSTITFSPSSSSYKEQHTNMALIQSSDSNEHTFQKHLHVCPQQYKHLTSGKSTLNISLWHGIILKPDVLFQQHWPHHEILWVKLNVMTEQFHDSQTKLQKPELAGFIILIQYERK